jgi:hypothetical protein
MLLSLLQNATSITLFQNSDSITFATVVLIFTSSFESYKHKSLVLRLVRSVKWGNDTPQRTAQPAAMLQSNICYTNAKQNTNKDTVVFIPSNI